jgi:hypothetical protein
LVETRPKAIGVVDGMLDDPEFDPASRLRAAHIVLDRFGMGPTSKIEHEVEVKPYEQLLKEGPSSATWPCLLAKARSSTPRTSLLCCASG